MHQLLSLFLNSIFISAITFGGGSLPLFEQYAVTKTHLLSSADFSAIVAFGFASPGPAIFGISTFLGYRIAGVVGALVGTLGAFLLPWLLAMITARYFEPFLRHLHLRSFSRAVTLAAAGLLLVTALGIVRQAPISLFSILIVVGALIATIRKVNPLFILLVSGLLGLFIR
jgi:chromate transporter